MQKTDAESVRTAMANELSKAMRTPVSQQDEAASASAARMSTRKKWSARQEDKTQPITLRLKQSTLSRLDEIARQRMLADLQAGAFTGEITAQTIIKELVEQWLMSQENC